MICPRDPPNAGRQAGYRVPAWAAWLLLGNWIFRERNLTRGQSAECNLSDEKGPWTWRYEAPFPPSPRLCAPTSGTQPEVLERKQPALRSDIAINGLTPSGPRASIRQVSHRRLPPRRLAGMTRLAALFVYPVKSLGGVQVESAAVDALGLVGKIQFPIGRSVTENPVSYR